MADPKRVSISISDESFGGVWSNLARVSHSQFEFTIDFARVDYNAETPTGVVVSRVNMSPLMVSQLIDALTSNWDAYARKALPQEVYDDDSASNAVNDDRTADDR